METVPFCRASLTFRPLRVRRYVPAGSRVKGEEAPIAAEGEMGRLMATIVPGMELKVESGDLKSTTSRPGFELSTVKVDFP